MWYVDEAGTGRDGLGFEDGGFVMGWRVRRRDIEGKLDISQLMALLRLGRDALYYTKSR